MTMPRVVFIGLTVIVDERYLVVCRQEQLAQHNQYTHFELICNLHTSVVSIDPVELMMSLITVVAVVTKVTCWLSCMSVQ